jgi:glycine cleavage system H protein
MGVPADCKYTKDHEWTRQEGGNYVVGITDYAQHQLGDVVFLELPKVGTVVKKGDSMAVVESVKAASDIYAPLSGKIVEVNQSAVDAPEIINSDPYQSAWLVKIEISEGGDVAALMDADSYDKLVQELG